MSSIYSTEYRRLIGELVRARKAEGLTQVDVAKTLRRPQSFVSKYERFERRLDVIEFMHVARVVSLNALRFLKQI